MSTLFLIVITACWVALAAVAVLFMVIVAPAVALFGQRSATEAEIKPTKRVPSVVPNTEYEWGWITERDKRGGEQ